MTKQVGEWEPAPPAKAVGEWEPVERASAPFAASSAPSAEDVLARLNAAIADHDYAAIGAAQEDLKIANQARVAAGQAAIPMPSLVSPAPAQAASAPRRDDSTSNGLPMLAQRGIGALAGAALGFTGAAAPAGAKYYMAKKALDKLIPDRAEPSLGSGQFASEPVETSSPWSPRPTPATPVANPTIPMEGAPAVDYGDTPYQRELNQQEGTHQRAARNKVTADTAEKLGLNVNEPVANFSDVRTTKGGVLANKATVDAIDQDAQDAQTKRANAIANARAQRQQGGLTAATQAGSQWQDLYRRGQELAASAEADSQKLGNVLKQKALDWWRTGVPPLNNWLGRAASAGAGLGFAVPGAAEKWQNDNNAGALQELGTGAAVGTALSYVPSKVAGPLNTGVQGMDSIARGSQGDYLGSTLSAVGAVGPYAAAALFPEVAIPAAAATAVIPPALNIARDYYRRHYGTPAGALPTQ